MTRRRSFLRLTAILAALLMLVAACGDDDDGGGAASPADDDGTSEATGDQPSDSDRIVIALSPEPPDLDPYGQDQNAPDSQVYQQLMQFDQQGDLQPYLAADMPEQIDDLTWEVPIREDVTFHDGTELTAQVVAASLNLLFDVGAAESVEETLRLGPSWDSAEVVDDMTVRINLSAPTPLLAELLATIHIVQPDNHQPNDPVGTGPYQFVEWNRGQSVVLERFPEYWGEEPEVDEIEYRFIPEVSTQIAAFQAGEVDVLMNLTPTDAQQLPEDRFVTTEGGDFNMVVPNLREGVTADPRVRQAMNYAVDKEAFNDQFFNGDGTIEACQQLKPNYLGFNPDLEPYPYDPDRARELIAEAGAEGGTIEIVTPEGRWPSDREQTEAIAAMWSEVGLNASPRVFGVPEDYLDSILRQPERPTAYFGNRSTNVLDGSNMQSYFSPPGVDGPSSVTEEIANRFTEISAITDLEERDNAWQEFYADACDGAYFVFLVSPPAVWAQSDKIAELNPVPIMEASWTRVADIQLD